MSPQISTTLTNAWMICCISQPISTTPRTAEGWMVDGKCSDIMMPPATWEIHPTGFWWWNIYLWRWASPKFGMFHLTETWLKPVFLCIFAKRAVKKPRENIGVSSCCCCCCCCCCCRSWTTPRRSCWPCAKMWPIASRKREEVMWWSWCFLMLLENIGHAIILGNHGWF